LEGGLCLWHTQWIGLSGASAAALQQLNQFLLVFVVSVATSTRPEYPPRRITLGLNPFLKRTGELQKAQIELFEISP
jgi:hypothetical protein